MQFYLFIYVYGNNEYTSNTLLGIFESGYAAVIWGMLDMHLLIMLAYLTFYCMLMHYVEPASTP